MQPPPTGRLSQLRALAPTGLGVTKIAHRLGMKPERLVQMAAAHGIDIVQCTPPGRRRREQPVKAAQGPGRAQGTDWTATRAEMARRHGGYVERGGRMVWQRGEERVPLGPWRDPDGCVCGPPRLGPGLLIEAPPAKSETRKSAGKRRAA
jgi:hypothetical protein